MRRGSGLLLFSLVLFPILLLGFTLGMIATNQGRPSAAYQREMEILELETATRIKSIKVTFWAGLVVIILLGTTGTTVGLIRIAWKRASLIFPHANGLFPVIQGRAAGQTYFHDLNRQLAGTVTYSTSSKGVVVRHVIPPDDQGEQLQVTSQAQATQLVAAAHQGQGLTHQSQKLAGLVMQGSTSRRTPRLPEVVVLDEAIPEDRHFLTALRGDWED